MRYFKLKFFTISCIAVFFFLITFPSVSADDELIEDEEIETVSLFAHMAFNIEKWDGIYYLDPWEEPDYISNKIDLSGYGFNINIHLNNFFSSFRLFIGGPLDIEGIRTEKKEDIEKEANLNVKEDDARSLNINVNFAYIFPIWNIFLIGPQIGGTLSNLESELWIEKSKYNPGSPIDRCSYHHKMLGFRVGLQFGWRNRTDQISILNEWNHIFLSGGVNYRESMMGGYLKLSIAGFMGSDELNDPLGGGEIVVDTTFCEEGQSWYIGCGLGFAF